MITAIFVDNKGFKRAEVLPQPVPTYRFPVYHAPRFPYSDEPNQLLISAGYTSYIGFYRYKQIDDDVYEYHEE